MQAVVKLPLESPFKLWVFEITRMQFEVVGMHGHTRILELDDDLNALALLASTEVEQGVFIKTKLGKNALQLR